jgi:hypothetical protein
MLTFYGIERNLNMWAAKGWGLKLDIADECAWSAELRITTDTSVNEGKCDISTVFFSGGHVCPQDAANAVYADAFAHFREQEQPQDGMIDPIVTDKDVAAQVARHKAAMAVPVSDPDKFTRCDVCEKEIPRPEWCKVGESTICDACIPF